jgi:hypothetical protein
LIRSNAASLTCAVVLSALALSPLIGPTSSAIADGTGSITGLVLYNGQPLSGICVDAVTGNATDGQSQYSATTSGDGRFTIASLAIANYHVRAHDCVPGAHVTGWYNGTSTATAAAEGGAVPVPASISPSPITLPLTLGGSITGPVTTAVGNSIVPVGCNCVQASAAYANDWSFYTQTDASGSFTFSGLPSASYRITYGTSDCNGKNYAQKYYFGTTSSLEATPVPVTSGKTSNASIRIPAGASIAVTAVDPSGAPLSNMCAYAYGLTTSGHIFYFGGSSDSTGVATVRGLPSGTYVVQVADCEQNDRLATYYGDAYTEAHATQVVLSAGASAGPFTVHMQRAGSMSGHVYAGTGTATADGLCIRWTNDPSSGSEQRLGVDGAYNISGLAPGKYKLNAGNCYFTGQTNLLFSYYGGGQTDQAATPLNIAFGSNLTNLDFHLATGAMLTGILKDANGTALAGVCVSLFDPNAPVDGASATTDASGRYTIYGAYPTKYLVQFDRGCELAGFDPSLITYYSTTGTAVHDQGSASSVKLVAYNGTPQVADSKLP